MNDDEVRGLDHAWRYFALHAEQRMTVFNFFVASAGLALTGMAWTLADGSRRWPLGVAAGLGAAALSFVFWRLDQRGAQLVKAAEDALAISEAKLPSACAVVTAERALASNAGWSHLSSPWTFGRSFRLLFSVVALLGILGAGATCYLGLRREPVRGGDRSKVVNGAPAPARGPTAPSTSAGDAATVAAPIHGTSTPPAGPRTRSTEETAERRSGSRRSGISPDPSS